MTQAQFRYAFFARNYEATMAFYQDALGLPVVESWDRGQNDRGTLFQAAAGMVEVMAFPQQPEEDAPWDYRKPQGVWMVIEVEQVDQLYQRALAQNLPLQEGLKDQPWGHRSFMVSDPNDLTIYFFSRTGEGGTV